MDEPRASGGQAGFLSQKVAAPQVLTYMPSFETAARSLNVASTAAPVRSDAEIETAITALGREPGGGLVVLGGRASIISAAARNSVPAVYAGSQSVRGSGLLSYGTDPVDLWRRAATYVNPDQNTPQCDDRDSAVQQAICHRVVVLSFRSSTGGG